MFPNLHDKPDTRCGIFASTNPTCNGSLWPDLTRNPDRRSPRPRPCAPTRLAERQLRSGQFEQPALERSAPVVGTLPRSMASAIIFRAPRIFEPNRPFFSRTPRDFDSPTSVTCDQYKVRLQVIHPGDWHRRCAPCANPLGGARKFDFNLTALSGTEMSDTR